VRPLPPKQRTDPGFGPGTASRPGRAAAGSRRSTAASSTGRGPPPSGGALRTSGLMTAAHRTLPARDPAWRGHQYQERTAGSRFRNQRSGARTAGNGTHHRSVRSSGAEARYARCRGLVPVIVEVVKSDGSSSSDQLGKRFGTKDKEIVAPRPRHRGDRWPRSSACSGPTARGKSTLLKCPARAHAVRRAAAPRAGSSMGRLASRRPRSATGWATLPEAGGVPRGG